MADTTTWLTQREAAAHVRLGVRSFRALVKAGRFPEGKLVSRRRKVWRACDLDAVLTGGKHADVSDPIMAAIHAAENAAAAHRAHPGQG